MSNGEAGRLRPASTPPHTGRHFYHAARHRLFSIPRLLPPTGSAFAGFHCARQAFAVFHFRPNPLI